MKFFILFFITIALISAYLGYRNSQQEFVAISPLPLVSPTPKATNTPFPTPAPTLPPISLEPPVDELMNQQLLKKIVDKAIWNSSSTYGVVVKNIKTGQSYGVNDTRDFQPASLYKLWVMATVYDMIEQGLLKESDVLSQYISVLNTEFDIDPEFAEFTEGSITLTVHDAVVQMITVSDNYAALLLTERVTNSAVQRYLTKHGLTHSLLGEPPVTTPSDIADFFEQLYTGKLANQENTDKMLTYLKNQQLNTKIPKYLPKSLTIAHKTGELGNFTHDAGIIYGKYGDYILVVLTEGANTEGSEERIATLSKAVYEYFENP